MTLGREKALFRSHDAGLDVPRSLTRSRKWLPLAKFWILVID
jgi:hypothetical protein